MISEWTDQRASSERKISAITDKPGLSEQQQPLACQSFNKALWLADHHDRLEFPESAADAIAQAATSTQDLPTT